MAKKKRVRGKLDCKAATPVVSQNERKQAAARNKIFALERCLPKKMRSLIWDVAGDGWVSRLDPNINETEFENECRRWDRLRDRFLQDTTECLELHAFALNYNSDGGLKPLLRLIRHPFVDAGTALWLYWESEPYYLQQYASAAACDDDDIREAIQLSRAIERRFHRDDFKTAMIPFDPAPWASEDLPSTERVKHKIPLVMYKAVGPPKRKNCR